MRNITILSLAEVKEFLHAGHIFRWVNHGMFLAVLAGSLYLTCTWWRLFLPGENNSCAEQEHDPKEAFAGDGFYPISLRHLNPGVIST